MKKHILRLSVFAFLVTALFWGCTPSEEEVFMNRFCKEWRTTSIQTAKGKTMPAPIRTRSSTVEFQNNGVALSHEKDKTRIGKWTLDKSTGASVITITDDSTQKSYNLQIEEITDTSLVVSMPDQSTGGRNKMLMEPFNHENLPIKE